LYTNIIIGTISYLTVGYLVNYLSKIILIFFLIPIQKRIYNIFGKSTWTKYFKYFEKVLGPSVLNNFSKSLYLKSNTNLQISKYSI